VELIVRQGGREERLRLTRTAQGFEVALAGRTLLVDAAAVADGVWSLRTGAVQHEVSVHRLEEGRYQVAWRGGAAEVEVTDPLTFLARSTHEAAGPKGPRRVTAYMPGRVVAVLAREGEEVAAGQGIVVLEAMKMENEIQAEHAGVVRKILVEPGQSVEGGEALFELG
jgi:biotin carboxyl carrier protein